MDINIPEGMLQYLLTNNHSDIFNKRQKIDTYLSPIEKSVINKKTQLKQI